MLCTWQGGSDTEEEGRKEAALELCHFLGVKENSRQRNNRSKCLKTEKCKICVVNDREPNVTVTNYDRV